MTQFRLRLLSSAIVLVPLLGFPVLMLAQGAPPFPSRSECVHPATDDDGELELVYGRRDSPAAAQALLNRVLEAGFAGTEVKPDGCGRWKVTYDGIDTFVLGSRVVEEARRVGLDPHLEYEG